MFLVQSWLCSLPPCQQGPWEAGRPAPPYPPGGPGQVEAKLISIQFQWTPLSPARPWGVESSQALVEDMAGVGKASTLLGFLPFRVPGFGEKLSQHPSSVTGPLLPLTHPYRA